MSTLQEMYQEGLKARQKTDVAMPDEMTTREIKVLKAVTQAWRTTSEIHQEAQLSSVYSTTNALRRLRARDLVESFTHVRKSTGHHDVTVWKLSEEV